MDIIIYHNPACGTSRNVLGMIRDAGIEPHVIEYLKCPPSRALLAELVERAGVQPRDWLRVMGTDAEERGLTAEGVDGETILDAMIEQPILINRPIVVSPKGVKLCRPKETVAELLP